MGVLWNRFHSRSLWPMANTFPKITHVAWGFHQSLDKICFNSAMLMFQLCRWNRFKRTKFDMPLQQLPKKLAPVLIWPIILTTTIGKTMTPAASWSVPQLRRACTAWLYGFDAKRWKSSASSAWWFFFVTCHSCQSKSLKWRKSQMSGGWFLKAKIYLWNTLRDNFWKNRCNLTVPMMTLGCLHMPQLNKCWNPGTCSEPPVLPIWTPLIPSWPVNQQIPSVSILQQK